MNIKVGFWMLLLLVCPFMAKAGPIEVNQIEPPHWWVGMEESQLELLVFGKDISSCKVKLDHPGVKLLKTEPAENPDYLYLTLEIGPEAMAGEVNIKFKKGRRNTDYRYTLKARDKSPDRIQGLDGSDFIYLIMPDRFANGDPNNDDYADMNQHGEGRDVKYGRHGGDLQGIIDKLDYIEALGVTTLWLNPVLENDQPFESYHGYAATDHYKIDKRLGDHQTYLRLINDCHKRGMKVIKDVIHNHVGDQHWIAKNPPSKDWIHQYETFTKTTYRATTLMDPYAAEADKKLMSDGWFDHHMPDLNQKNPHLATYFIQNNIWWIEEAGLDGFRIDTYAYPDQAFMADWAEAILKEYPDFGLFGETWVHGLPIQAFFTGNNKLSQGRNSQLPAVTDFQLYYAINDALSQDFGWTEGLMRLYYTLAQDFVYDKPEQNVVFVDNHDLDRFYSKAGKNLDNYKMGMGFLLTTRGIPMMYYGTEVLMSNYFDWGDHDVVREEFPGGWSDHESDKFSAAGRSAEEQEAFVFVSTLANFRKSSKALASGKLTQFVPQEGIYVYFRIDPTETVMVILNQNKEDKQLKTGRFKECIGNASSAQDILTEGTVDLNEEIALKARSIRVLKLR